MPELDGSSRGRHERSTFMQRDRLHTTRTSRTHHETMLAERPRRGSRRRDHFFVCRRVVQTAPITPSS
jgi:hypothetical protein